MTDPFDEILKDGLRLADAVLPLKTRLKHLNQDKKVKFLNHLRFDIIAQGDPKRKVSDFEMMTAADSDWEIAYRYAMEPQKPSPDSQSGVS